MRYLDVFGAENTTVEDLQNIQPSALEYFLPPVAQRQRLVEYIDLHIRALRLPKMLEFVSEEKKTITSNEATSQPAEFASSDAVEIGEAVVKREKCTTNESLLSQVHVHQCLCDCRCVRVNER